MSDTTNPPPSDLPSEPARDTGVVAMIVGALLALLVSFGLPITEEQQINILKLVVLVYPFVVFGIAWIIRQRVYAPDTTQALRIEAFGAGRAGRPLPPLDKPPADATLTAPTDVGPSSWSAPSKP